MNLNNSMTTYRAAASAAKLAANRLIWDLFGDSARSGRILRRLKGRFKGRSAVIACNGPSLNRVDFSILSDVHVFGLNKINLLFDRVDFRPDFIVAVNKHVIDQTAPFFEQTMIPLFLDSHAYRRKLVSSRENVCFLQTGGYGFAPDCSMTVPQGHTVTYVALQLAYHMGFSRVALVGCDHNFVTKGPGSLVVTAAKEDPNHFDPRYFSDGMTWQLPDLFESEIAYLRARAAFENDGRTIVNATEGGNLEVFDRMSLVEFLRGK